jgi:nitrous oxide reductase
MMIKKKDRFQNKRDRIYEIAGKWGSDYVLSPVNDEDDICLIYSLSEMEEFIQEGDFKRLGGKKQ